MIYQEELPKIEASEHLALISSFAVASGSLKKNDSTRVLNQLERAAAGKRRERARPSPMALAAMGIGVEIVKRKEKADG